MTIGMRSMDQPHDASELGARVDVGANAVVLSDVPSGAMAVGIPARIVSS